MEKFNDSITQRLYQPRKSCYACVYMYHYTITTCSHTLCNNCFYAAVEEKIDQQLEAFICPRCPDKEESRRLNLQQQLLASNSMNNDNSINVQVLSEKTEKLSIDNVNLENKINSKELLVNELEKQKDDLIRSGQQLLQKFQDIQKQFPHNEEKLTKGLNEAIILHKNQLNEFEHRTKQLELELDNEKLRHEEIIHVEPTTPPSSPTLNSDEREQIKKLSIDNANLEKQAHRNELLAKEAQKEKEDLVRYNKQLAQSLQNAEKDLKHIEEKHHKQLNESQTLHLNEINDYKRRIEQLETDNEQLRREEIGNVEPTNTTTDIETITKQPFNVLPTYTTTQDKQSDDNLISPTSNDEQEDDHDTKMDCSTITERIKFFDNNMNDNRLLQSKELPTVHIISSSDIQHYQYHRDVSATWIHLSSKILSCTNENHDWFRTLAVP